MPSARSCFAAENLLDGEKSNLIADYIKNLKNPFVIKTNQKSSAVVFTSSKSAKNITTPNKNVSNIGTKSSISTGKTGIGSAGGRSSAS